MNRFLLVALGTVLVLPLVALAVVWYLLTSFQDPWHERVADAGYQHKTARVNDVELGYVEGPDNGPPLILLHAQHMEWFSYSRVMPALSASFHVFAIDYPGHGSTTYSADYPMTANQIGSDLATFIEYVVGEPAFVTGNSSGGLLSVWLAVNAPNLVKAVLLEDPPLFSAEYPRIKETVAYKSFIATHNYIQENANDFLLYWIASNAAFFDNNVFKGAASLLARMIEMLRAANPDTPPEIRFLPNDTVKLMVRGLDSYDARFGAAFYDGSWNEGFDHAQALQKIACPVLLVHANFRYLEDGTLSGAMSQEEADRAMSLMPNAQYLRLDASHVVHLDQPAKFIEVLDKFFQ